MTTDDRFARNLSAWLVEDGAQRVPDHLAEVLVHSAATRQRPWWSSPERWLPVDTTLRPRLFNTPSAGRLLAVALLVLLAAAIAAFAIGSQHRLPAPFGIVANGAVIGSRDGDLYRFDVTTGQATLLLDDPAYDFGATYSRDGTKFAFLRSDARPPAEGPAVLTLMLANADGTDLHAITAPTRALDWLDWSPDSAHFAYIANGTLKVLDTTTGVSTVLHTGQPAHMALWLPPKGDEIIFRGESSTPGIFAIKPDGSGLRQISRTAPINDSDFGSLAVAPDGSRIAFTRWSSNGSAHVHSIDLASGKDVAYPTSSLGTHEAVFSPDATSITYATVVPGQGTQLAIADADASGGERMIGPVVPRAFDGPVPVFWNFTPDGKTIVARFGTDESGTTYLIPLDGSESRILDAGAFEFVDVQRVAP
jgi:dipeptidyl aminopeptidase/acylaminoacyl peptidase